MLLQLPVLLNIPKTVCKIICVQISEFTQISELMLKGHAFYNLSNKTVSLS